MAKQKTPKANYKVFNTKTEKYLSASRSKSTWQTKGWAMEAARTSNWKLEDLELHIFPISDAIRIPCLEIEKEMIQELAKLKLAKQSKAEADSIRRLASEIERTKQELERKKQVLDTLEKQYKNKTC